MYSWGSKYEPEIDDKYITANSHWQKDGANITTGNKYRGTTTNTLTLLNATEADEGMYTLIARSSSFNIMISIGKIQCMLFFNSRVHDYST